MKSYNLKGADACISTMSDSMLNWADLYEPLKQAIKKQIFSSLFVHADESPLKYGRGKGEKFKQGSVHVYRDSEQWSWEEKIIFLPAVSELARLRQPIIQLWKAAGHRNWIQ
jgi:hypothetical protein